MLLIWGKGGLVGRKYTIKIYHLLPILVAALIFNIFGCFNESSKPLIFAATSLSDVLQDTAELYQNKTGEEIDFNFAGSYTLVNQIKRFNAPADLAIFSGTDPMKKLLDANLVDGSKIHITAGNRLVIVAKKNKSPLTKLIDIVSMSGDIAIADPNLAPAGSYAFEALRNNGIYEQLKSRIIPTVNVRAALTSAAMGTTDFAITYRTDAIREPRVNVIFEIPERLHSKIVYPYAVVKKNNSSEKTQRFFEFLSSNEAKNIFREHGFNIPKNSIPSQTWN